MNEIISGTCPNGRPARRHQHENFLLVTGKTPSGDPEGVAPDMAREIATAGHAGEIRAVRTPVELADAAGNDAWDIGLIGAEPHAPRRSPSRPPMARSRRPTWCPPDSPLQSIADVDRARRRASRCRRAAPTISGWSATSSTPTCSARTWRQAPLDQFIAEKLEALAGLRPGLLGDVKKVPARQILTGQFHAVQQAIGTEKKNTAGAAFLAEFVAEAKRTGLVAKLIERHHVVGLSVAP